MGNTANRWLTVAGLGLLAALAGWLHLRSGMAFPRPWPDEAHFITPALTLVRDARLAAPELNAPSGIFWMPTGYYVAQVPLLVLRVDPLSAARWLSWIGVMGFGAAVAGAAIKAGANRYVVLAAVGVWLCLPRVVAIANIARMEGPVLGLAGLCLWLLTRDRWLAAVAVALLAPLVHPVGFIVVVAVAAARLVTRPQRPAGRADWVVLAGAVALWVAEVAYFAGHAQEAAAHLRFQFTRKAGRPIEVRWWHALLLTVSAAGGLAATVRWRRATPALAAVWVALAMAGGFVLVDLVGREMWYEPLGRETVVLLLGLVGTVVASRIPATDVVRYATCVVVVVGLVFGGAVALRATLTDGWYGMRPGGAATQEWHAFTQTALGELKRLDASGEGTQLVVVDPLSGFGQELVARPWSRLRFVQPTPATPMDTTTADYVLATPGAPFVTEALVTQWGEVAPVLDVTSQSGLFTLQLFENPD